MIEDYIKSVIANKATLIGYAFIVGSAGSLLVDTSSLREEYQRFILANQLLGFTVGCGLQYLTSFGKETLAIYHRTKEHIESHQDLDERYVIPNIRNYCNFAGMRLAAKEAGLETVLKQTIKRDWDRHEEELKKLRARATLTH